MATGKIMEGETMTWVEFWRCDTCGKKSENYECALNQMKFAITESHDFGRTFHFCCIECLRVFVARPQEEWKSNIEDGDLMHGRTMGEHTKEAAGRHKVSGEY